MQRADVADELGERETTFAIIRELRSRLSAVPLPTGIRAPAEVALEMEASDALAHDDYEHAGSLVEQYRSLVTDESVARSMDLIHAFGMAATGARADAAQLVADIALGVEDDAERQDLLALADALSDDETEKNSFFAAHASTRGQRDTRLAVRPNPSTGRATIQIPLDEEAEVRAAIYDVLGREVAVLHEGYSSFGAVDLWFDGSSFPDGVYVIRVTGRYGGGSDFAYTESLTIRR
jgi:hypothetical protein